MNRKIEFSSGEWYHCYNRGVDKRRIFLSKQDYERFLSLLYLANSRIPVRLDNIEQFQQGSTLLDKTLRIDRDDTIVEVGAYSLMPNHFHFLLQEKYGGGISEFMRKISTGYTMYFNKKNERTGPLFSGTFQARHVADDRYFKRVFNYIHANSAELIEPKWKSGIIKNREKTFAFLKSYPYASLPDYSGVQRNENNILNMECVKDMYESMPTIEILFTDALDFAKNVET